MTGQHTPPPEAVEAAAEAIAKMLGDASVVQYHRDFAGMVLDAAAPLIAAQAVIAERQRWRLRPVYTQAEHDEAVAQAAAEEREACAQLAEQYHVTVAYQCPAGDCDDNCGAILPLADLIRARGVTP